MVRLRRCLAAAAIAAALPALGIPAFGGAAGTGSAATFPIVAAQTPANGELNFNGADKGHLVITVPVGAAVQMTLTNKGSLPHSLEVIPFSDKLPATALPTPAFPGAQSKNPQVGIVKGQTETVSFAASKPGKYLLICGFPGHALLGMYGIFEVSPAAGTKRTMVVKK